MEKHISVHSENTKLVTILVISRSVRLSKLGANSAMKVQTNPPSLSMLKLTTEIVLVKKRLRKLETTVVMKRFLKINAICA